MKTREEIEAIAYRKYPSIFQAKDANVEYYRLRRAFIEAYEQAQNESQQSHADLFALRDEVIKVWNEDGENGDIQMKTPIAWYRVLRIAEQTIEKPTK